MPLSSHFAMSTGKGEGRGAEGYVLSYHHFARVAVVHHTCGCILTASISAAIAAAADVCGYLLGVVFPASKYWRATFSIIANIVAAAGAIASTPLTGVGERRHPLRARHPEKVCLFGEGSRRSL